MPRHATRTRLLATLLALLFLPGCIVLEERLKRKEEEADALREAVAQSTRKNAACEARGEEMLRDLATTRKTGEELSAKVRTQEEELDRLRGNLTETKKDYEGATVSREELIRELLEKEKGTGRKIQELALKASEAEGQAEGLRKELARTKVTGIGWA